MIYRTCFLAERNKNVGFGHFSRCQKISNHLDKSLSFASTLVLFGEQRNPFENMHNNYKSAFNFIRKNRKKFDLVIVDSYSVTDEMLQNIRKLQLTVGYIEDSKELSRTKSDFFIKLNSEFHRNDETYGIPVIGYENFAKLLQTYHLKKNPLPFNPKTGKNPINIFVCLGGLDTSGEATDICKSILKNVQGSIVQYWSLIHDEKINSLVEENSSITLITGEKDIRKGLEWADVAIVSGGNIAHEVLGAKIPTIILPLIGNQHEISRYYSDQFSVPAVITVNKAWDAVDWQHNIKLANKSQQQMKIAKSKKGSLANDLLKLLKNRWDINCLVYPNFKKNDIKLEYQKHSAHHKEFLANRWGSQNSASNRYNIIIEVMKTNDVRTWLDIGCGTAGCQKQVSQEMAWVSGIGIEQSSNLLQRAKAKKITAFHFVESILNINQRKFDLITCIGVLSKTNLTLKKVLELIEPYCNENSIIIIDLPNLDWEKFQTHQLAPDPRHLWFKPDWLINFSSKAKNFSLVSFYPLKEKGEWFSISKINENRDAAKASHCNYWMFKYESH